MSDLHSVSELMRQLKSDESDATRQIWDRFIDRLISEARKRLKSLPRRAADEEDVALSAFEAFFRGVNEQRFHRLDSRDDLWQVLAMLAERKAIAVLRRELADKRGGGLNRGESVFENLLFDSTTAVGIDQVADPDPNAIEDFTLEVRERLEGLDNHLLRQIAVRKLEGFTNQEIAGQLGIALRAVERKLQLIRQKWLSSAGTA
jgi:DNA-directed RNA polymerase specialized sigma24 family protein